MIVKTHPGRDIALRSLEQTCEILQAVADGKPMPKQETGEVSALVQNILFAISRRRAWMDWMLEQRSHAKIRPRVRRILWWALAQIFSLNGLNAAIVTDVACRYAQRRYSVAESGFVNAMLRGIVSDMENGELPTDSAQPDHVKAGMPVLLWERWCAELGHEKAMEICQLLQKPATLTCRLRGTAPENFNVPSWMSPVADCDWCQYNVTFMRNEDAEDCGEIPLKNFYIQDPSTLLAPAMLHVQPGERVADICSAPGGKALIIAESMQNSGRLFCCDRSLKRLQKVKENLKDFTNVTYCAEDGKESTLENDSFDAVLLDVPCTNTGVIRRRPDVRWTFSTEKLAEVMHIQSGILERSALLLKSSGRLVYSTCSIEPEENTLQVSAFLKRHPEFVLLKDRQLYPGISHDGAYAALLKKL